MSVEQLGTYNLKTTKQSFLQKQAARNLNKYFPADQESEEEQATCVSMKICFSIVVHNCKR